MSDTTKDRGASQDARSGSPSVASEINNLLEIIYGTSSLIENIWEGNESCAKIF